MSAGLNTNLKSQLEQAMATLNNLGANSSTTKASGESAPYINSVFNLVQNGEAYFEGGDEQKVQATVNIIDGILGLISFAQDQRSKADKEVKANNDAITQNEQLADKKATEVEQKIANLSSSIDTNTSNINDAIEKIEALGGDKGTLKELKDAVKEQLDKIEDAKKKLNDPEERENALAAISEAADIIKGLVEQVDNIQSQIDSQTEIVNNNVNQATNTIETSATEIANGIELVQKAIQTGASLGAQAGTIGTQGATDVPVGEVEIQAGETINSNTYSSVVSGGKGVKLIMDGNQRKDAGQTRINGCAKNISALSFSIGKMGVSLAEFQLYTNKIGELGQGVNKFVDLYNNAYISSVGTFNAEAIAEANQNFQDNVKKLLEGKYNPNEEKQSQADTEQESDNTQSQGAGKDDFLGIEKLKVAFGI